MHSVHHMGAQSQNQFQGRQKRIAVTHITSILEKNEIGVTLFLHLVNTLCQTANQIKRNCSTCK